MLRYVGHIWELQVTDSIMKTPQINKKKMYSNELDLNKISKWLVQILNNILKIAL